MRVRAAPRTTKDSSRKANARSANRTMNDKDLPPFDPPPEDHDCDEWCGKVRGDGGEAMIVCTACEYHK